MQAKGQILWFRNRPLSNVWIQTKEKSHKLQTPKENETHKSLPSSYGTSSPPKTTTKIFYKKNSTQLFFISKKVFATLMSSLFKYKSDNQIFLKKIE